MTVNGTISIDSMGLTLIHEHVFLDWSKADSVDKSIWIKEFEDGIDNTGTRPGFIKIGMDSKAPLTETDEKLVRAAAQTHLKTGLTIVSHTGTDTTAAQELTILKGEGVAPEAFVWTHAQRGTQAGHIRLAQKGAWISLDGMGWIRPDTATNDSSALYQYIDFLENLKINQLLHRTLISHDAGWYTVGEEHQNNYKPYTPIFDLVIPILRERGFTQEDIDILLIKNPQNAYALRVRAEK